MGGAKEGWIAPTANNGTQSKNKKKECTHDVVILVHGGRWFIPALSLTKILGLTPHFEPFHALFLIMHMLCF
jgi:hypothetical protein